MKPHRSDRLDTVKDCRFDYAGFAFGREQHFGRGAARIGDDVSQLAFLDSDETPDAVLGGMLSQQTCFGV